jgi:hypothetical protein
MLAKKKYYSWGGQLVSYTQHSSFQPPKNYQFFLPPPQGSDLSSFWRFILNKDSLMSVPVAKNIISTKKKEAPSTAHGRGTLPPARRLLLLLRRS